MAKERHKMITCLLPKGKGIAVLKILKDELNVVSAHFNHARGSGIFTTENKWGIGQQVEKDVVQVIISEKRADEIFDFLYERAEINQPHGGFMYMAGLENSTSFELPKLPEER